MTKGNHCFRVLDGVKCNLAIGVISQYVIPPSPLPQLQDQKSQIGVIFEDKHQKKIITIAWQLWDFASTHFGQMHNSDPVS